MADADADREAAMYIDAPCMAPGATRAGGGQAGKIGRGVLPSRGHVVDSVRVGMMVSHRRVRTVFSGRSSGMHPIYRVPPLEMGL